MSAPEPAHVAPRDEPPGDAVQRVCLRASMAGFYLVGMLAVGALFLPRGVLLDPGAAGALRDWLPMRPDAHARGMALAFVTVFVLGFVCRILPRARGEALPRPGAAKLGAVVLLGTGLLDAAGGANHGPGRLLLALGWTAGTLLWTASLGALWFRGRPERAWFEGWVGGGLLVSAGVVLAAAGAALADARGVLLHTAAALLVGGLTPVAVGISGRMLPSLAGIGPLDRDRATVPTAWVAAAAGSAAVGLLLDIPVVATCGLLLLGALALRMARAMAGLRLRADGPEALQAARREPETRALRWGARAAWLCLAVGLAALAASFGGRALGSPAVVELRAAYVIGVHLAGAGFLVGMLLSVGQRAIPAFLGEDIRWPRLRHVLWLLWLGAIALRVVGSLWPVRMIWTMHGSMGLLLFAVVLFQLQIGRSVRRPSAS